MGESRSMKSLTFSAQRSTGERIASKLGFPTVNVRIEDVPKELDEGIYACKVFDGTHEFPGVMHYGSRPFHQKSPSCEVHLFWDEEVELAETLSIQIIGYIRPILQFAIEKDLQRQIEQDIVDARGILGIS